MERLSPPRTAPRLASMSAPCGRALSMKTCTSPHRQLAGVADLPSSKERSTSSTVTAYSDSNYADGGYTVGICSRTALLGQAQADLDALGEGHAPQAGTGGPSPEQPQDMVVGRTWVIVWRTYVGNHTGGCRGVCCGGWGRGVLTFEASVGRSGLEVGVLPARGRVTRHWPTARQRRTPPRCPPGRAGARSRPVSRAPVGSSCGGTPARVRPRFRLRSSTSRSLRGGQGP